MQSTQYGKVKFGNSTTPPVACGPGRGFKKTRLGYYRQSAVGPGAGYAYTFSGSAGDNGFESPFIASWQSKKKEKNVKD